MSSPPSSVCVAPWPNAMSDFGSENPAFDPIAVLLTKGFAAPLSDEDLFLLDRLLAETPGGEAFAEAYIQSWMLAGIAGRGHAHLEDASLPDELASVEPSVSHGPARWRWSYAAIGAVAAVLAVMTAWLLNPRFVMGSAVQTLVAGEATIDRTLADGSRVSLSRRGKVEVRLIGDRRTLRQLGGEAYYEVAKDHHRPFSVEVAGYRVTALGTRFNVAPFAGGPRVDLLEGRLRIEPLTGGAAPIFLVAGQSFRGGEHPSVSDADPLVAEWRKGRLTFDAVPLVDVAERLTRFSGQRITVDDDAVAGLRFSGVLRLDAPEDWPIALAAMLPVRVLEHPGGMAIVSSPRRSRTLR